MFSSDVLRGGPLALVLSALMIAGALPSTALAQTAGASTGVLMAKSALPQLNAFRQGMVDAIGKDEAVSDFFRARGYEAFWTASDSSSEIYRAALFAALDTAEFHALAVKRYDAEALRRAFRDLRSEGDRGRLEVRLTRALLDFAGDLHSGVVTPKRIDPTIVREVPKLPSEQILQGFLADPQAYLAKVAPQHPEYARLAKARLALKAQVAQGSWGPKVTGKGLRKGATGAAVVSLRDRLQAMGYLGATATQTFDAQIEAALKEFQAAHGLAADGVAGDGTLVELNRGPEERLKALSVAMERERWANIERGKRHIWVNLADFTTKIIDDGKVTFETRAVIGSTVSDKRTPEFSHRMTYMEINPDWTVPPGIIRRDYLPRLQKNPGALGHLQVVDSRGRVIPRESIDFAKYSPGNFPYMLRQPPGPTNSLGRVKFMFPNPWSIYLHDTPDKHLFARDKRAYSSGCVRLKDPFDFAYALLAAQTDDPRGTFHRALDSGKQQRITLKEPVPVHLDYRTAFTDVRGQVQYRGDIYGRDADIYAALVKAGVDG